MPDLILLGGQPNRISRRIRNIQLLRLICLASPSSHCFQAFCQRTFAAKRFKSQSPPRAAVNVQLSQFHGATLGNWGFQLCQSSSAVAMAKNSSTVTTSTGASGGWFASWSSFAGVSSPCAGQLMTSKGASVSRSQEQALGSLFELGGSRVGHGGGGSSALR